MEWTDSGLVIGTRRHGETSLILEVMTRERGRRLGMVKGGRGKRLAGLLQPGNSVIVTWNARIEEQLGQFQVEPARQRTGLLIDSPAALYGLSHLCTLLRLLPEREPHAALAEATEIIADHLETPLIAAVLIARFETRLLAELGFGIDLSACAATGATQDLIYVSPKSGRAVSRQAGAPWQDRLLPLPTFLTGATGEDPPDGNAIESAFRLTGHFLMRDVFEPRGVKMPGERDQFLSAVRRLASPNP
jgi:DNA repair protein RecO (recombination protein O)